MQSQADLFPTYYNKPEVRLDLPGYSNHTNYARLNQTQHQCDNVITLPEVNNLISTSGRVITNLEKAYSLDPKRFCDLCNKD